MSKRRLKVLVSAYACSPIRGSEPGMGWGFVEALSTYHDLWVITEKEKFQDEIELELERRPELRKHIRFFYIPKNRHRTLRKIWPPSYYWFYKKWQKKAYDVAFQLHKKNTFDVVHQLNMIGFREPGYLWKIDAPFVYGPVGGTQKVPLRFASILGIREFLFHLTRNIINEYQLRFSIRFRKAFFRADVFIAATAEMRNDFALILRRPCFLVNETGIVNSSLDHSGTKQKALKKEALRISWSGLHISCKALPLALRALAKLPHDLLWHLDILGDGPMRHRWQHLARKLAVDKNCTWHGWLSQSKATEIVAGTDIFLFTSLKEGTPHVVMEALSMRIPVICLDICGQKDIVTEECGIKIPLTTPRKITRELAAVITEVGTDADVLRKLSEGAAKFSYKKAHSYERKAKVVSALYEKAITMYNEKKSQVFSKGTDAK